MRFGPMRLLAALSVLYGFGSAPAAAQVPSPGPANGLDHIYRSLEELRDEARAQAGYHKARWVCYRSSGQCVWRPGYWGPPPPPKPAIRIQPIEEWGREEPDGLFD
ncbi:hypothetical protein [Beijerinckia indica]|uniref:Uncharacterized protein n=1 Tax=Beijerinckia indica subsp. indica (strain ATCC 9039 / DSM 1715 / NCIMB 8712) TaxID=395963 RepID=B2IBX2_BEII9|nr:hypothetical protein [Beijerinckia indica]ACB95230.1 hypothetical protein Bind_1598 [Beijerinckia indica subsp. indica ATCC 9039]